jgi:hypothetical protein
MTGGYVPFLQIFMRTQFLDAVDKRIHPFFNTPHTIMIKELLCMALHKDLQGKEIRHYKIFI